MICNDQLKVMSISLTLNIYQFFFLGIFELTSSSSYKIHTKLTCYAFVILPGELESQPPDSVSVQQAPVGLCE
jgi:hypothetical protein